MNRLQFDGAWEGDCLPAGQFVASFPDGRLVTHLGLWHAAEWIRYPRMSPITNFVAGTGQTSNRIIEVGPNMVSDKGPACGNSACAYWPDGRLEMNPDCGPPYFGLGIRWIDTVVHTGADTYIDSVRQIYEWTQHGEITAGQGGSGPHGEDPCVLLYNGRRYLLEGGTCRVIRFSRQDDLLAIGFFRMDQACFVAHWLTVAEIVSLQDITDDEPEPIPVCDNYEDRGDGRCKNCGHLKAEHDIEPEPDMDFPRTEWGTVEKMHARFAQTLPATEEGAREWTRMTIEQLAFNYPFSGWCWKSSSPTSPPSKDCIARQLAGRFEGWDVLQAAGVTGPRMLASYSPPYHALAGQHPIPVTAKDWLEDEPPPPPPDGELEERVEALERESLLQQGRITLLEERVSALEEAPPQTGVTPAQVLALIDSAFANAQFGGTTARGSIIPHTHGGEGLTIRRKP